MRLLLIVALIGGLIAAVFYAGARYTETQNLTDQIEAGERIDDATTAIDNSDDDGVLEWLQQRAEQAGSLFKD